MRRFLPLLLIAGLDAAEIARRDAQFAIEVLDGSFTYELHAPTGDFSGEDAFDRHLTARFGGRWALAGAGSSVAPLLGIDAIATDAALAGGTLRGAGAALCAGVTWACAERWSIDAEGLAGAQLANLHMPAGATSELVAGGPLLSNGLRIRLLWTPSRRWSMGVEGGWLSWNATLSGDAGRSMDMSGTGTLVGVVLAWRPSARPGDIE